jgi:hypothetical protein
MASGSNDPEQLRSRELQSKHQRSLERERSRLQAKLVSFVCCYLGIGLACALTIFLLQGFGSRIGFHLDASFMHWIGTATIGCVSTLAVLVYKCFFPASGIRKRGTNQRERST